MIQLNEIIEMIKMIVDSEDDINADVEFEFIPGWDSVNALRFFSQLEKEAGKALSMKNFLATRTVADVYQFVKAS